MDHSLNRCRLAWVYFITDGVAIKIGYSVLVESRRDALQGSHHAPLRILAQFNGTMRDERALHHHFAALRLNGEWFRDDPSIYEMIATLESERKWIERRVETISDVIAGNCRRFLPGTRQRKPADPEISKFRDWYKDQKGKLGSPEIERVAYRCFLDSENLVRGNISEVYAQIAAKEFAQLNQLLCK